MSRLISFAVLLAITVLFLALFYRVLAGFLIPIFLSLVLVVVFHPLHQWMLKKTKGRTNLAAGLSTFVILLCLMLPVGIIVATASIQGLRFIERNSAASIGLRLSKLRSSLALDMPHFGDLLRNAGHEVDYLVHQISDASISQQHPKLKEHAKKTLEAFEELKRDVLQQHGESWDVSSIDDLSEIARKLEARANSDSNSDELTELALSLKSKFGEVKTDLHGGALQSFLRDVTNPTQEDVESLRTKAMEYVRPKLLPMTGATGKFAFQLVFGLLILTLTLYFFLADGPAMIAAIHQMLPMDIDYQHELLSDFERTSRAVVVAMLAAAAVQGLTAGVGYLVAGMDYLVLLIMLTSVAALIPFVGPMVVWIPVCIYLAFVEQRFVAAGALAAWGLLVVATIDNVVKAAVLHGQSQLHPLLALLSILGGVQALGPVGIVVGPMGVSLLQTLLGIIRREMVDLDKHGFSPNKQEDSQTEAESEEPLKDPGNPVVTKIAEETKTASSTSDLDSKSTGTANDAGGKNA
jgi:predicted PurR-regulated permease PerM